MTFLNDVTPQMVVAIVGTTYKEKGASSFIAKSVGIEVTDNDTKSSTYGQKIFDIDLYPATIYTDEKVDLGIPAKVYDAKDFETFSLTNLAFSLDILIDSNGSLDVGTVINSVASQKILPEETIIVDAATGIRLQFALDADLNYGKEVYMGTDGKEHLVDNNYLILELYFQ